MAKYLTVQHRAESPQELLRDKIETARLDHAQAVLKAYALLDAAEQRGILDLLRGALYAEDKIVEKVAGYANTPEGINTMRSLLILGKLLGSMDPDVLKNGANDLSSSVVAESRKGRSSFLSLLRRLFGGDALRGMGLALSALESLGRAARGQGRK